MVAKGLKEAKVSMPPVCLLELEDEVRSTAMEVQSYFSLIAKIKIQRKLDL